MPRPAVILPAKHNCPVHGEEECDGAGEDIRFMEKYSHVCNQSKGLEPSWEEPQLAGAANPKKQNDTERSKETG